MDKSKNDAIDVKFTETDDELLENKNINKEPLYYNCMQVAQIVDEPDSTIRYWSKVFQPLLQIKTSNNVRKYTRTNIENLLFIKKLLKEDGLTVKQAIEYCSDKGFDNETGLIDTSNPLAVQTFISAMTSQMDKKILNMQEQIIQKQQEMIVNLTNMLIEREEKFRESISLTVDEVVSDKMDGYFDSLQQELAITQDIDKKIEDQSKQLQDNFDNMSEKIIDENRKELEKLKNEIKYVSPEEINKYQEKNKSWFSKIFNKK